MFSEILKVLPKIDSVALSAMERTLNGRFMKVAKKFGGGMMSALKGGGWVGVALGLIDKLLNPLQEVKETMDRMLAQSDDIVTNAQQFGSSAGELFKLQRFAQATGLDAESLNNLIVKFQGAVAEAAADPNKKTSVRAFAGDTNMVKAFFEFIQSLNKMERNQQVLVQQEVFGEKQTLKMADFLRGDFAGIQKRANLKDAAAYEAPVNKLGGLKDTFDENAAGLAAQDMINKSRLINAGMIESRKNADRLAMERENGRIASYKNLAAITATTDKMMILVEQGVAQIGKFISFATPAINKGVEALDRFSKSRWMRGIFGSEGK